MHKSTVFMFNIIIYAGIFNCVQGVVKVLPSSTVLEQVNNSTNDVDTSRRPKYQLSPTPQYWERAYCWTTMIATEDNDRVKNIKNVSNFIFVNTLFPGFPFYTIGRFASDACTGSNNLYGTCLVRGECSDNGGISAGSCSTLTSQAVCCIYQMSCGASTSFNNTYFYNSGYPGTYSGGGRCSIVVSPCDSTICQLRIDFLALSLAPPSGDGLCTTDALTITGGSSRVPTICGENSGQHVYVNFNGASSITISIATSASYTFNRQWQFQISQISCSSATLAPSGCLQYYMANSDTVSSFNYASAATSALNSIGVQGTRQIASQQYGICVRMGANMCSITWSQVSSDSYSFTVTNDVGAVDPTLLATESVQSQECTTDFIIIPNPTQGGAALTSDRFCGLGLVATTSAAKPFVLYTVTNANEDMDMSNRGFYLSYSQNGCPIM